MTYDPSILIPVEEAIRLLITATDFHEASRIRNGVAYAAMKRQRPEREADACREAFDDRWGHMVLNQRQGPIEPLQFTGD